MITLKEYNDLVDALDALMDTPEITEDHPLAGVMATIAAKIEEFENATVPSLLHAPAYSEYVEVGGFPISMPVGDNFYSGSITNLQSGSHPELLKCA